MRFWITLILFVIVGVTVTGSLMTVLLSEPVPNLDVMGLMPWTVAIGFLISLPISYVIAGMIMKRQKIA